MDESLSEYWHDAKQILKEQAQEKRKNCFDDRLEYARQQFLKNNIHFKLCNMANGHFNLYHNGKVVMSYWSYTGKCYIPSTGFSDNIGINKCVNKFKRLFK